MFSSIASFLPSALHIGSSDIQRPPQFSQDDPGSDDEQDDSQGSRSKQPSDQPQVVTKTREKTANESFIIVRPPPSKSNHPLNLQVQLVPPNVKPPNGVVSQSNTSIQSTATDSDHTLARTSSLRSESSYTNYGSSTSSFSSVASSSASTRRTIVPLYNLQAHNVMTNVIVDAGTDAKIARFQRRGIVLIDLASLEPVEVWGDSPSSAARASINLIVEDPQATNRRSSAFSSRSVAASSRAHTPERHPTAASSAMSLNPTQQSQSHSLQQSSLQPQPQLHPPPLPQKISAISDADSDSTPTLSTPQSAAPARRNIFGKLFQSSSNKRLSGPSNLLPSPSPSPISSSFADPPSSRASSHVTPKAPHQPQQSGVVTPKPSNNGGGGKTHARNISLTAFTAPIKTTFKNNRNKLSSAATGSSSSSSLNASVPDTQGIGLGIIPMGKGDKGVPSPNMSASSLAATTESVESGSVAHSISTSGNPLLQVTSHLHPPSHAHQPSTGSATSTPAPQTQLQKLQSRAPVLGIQPTFVSAVGSNLLGPSDTKKMRALMYVWLIRRWLKRPPHDEGVISFPGVAGRGGFLGLGTGGRSEEHGGNTAEPGAGVEVRFEWKRGKVKASGRGRLRKERSGAEYKRSRRRSTGTTASGYNDTREHEEGGQAEREKSRESKKRKSVDKRLSSLSTKSNQSIGSGVRGADSEEGAEGLQRGSSKRPRSAVVSASEGVGEGDRRDDGEESDPEDSETPWVCTLKVRRTTSASSTNDGFTKQSPKAGGEREVLKVKVGTLSPTPHHPKVVAMLKVPFPLPDVEVERLGLRRRTLSSIPGQGGVNELGEVSTPVPTPRAFPRGDRGTSGEYSGLELSAEEIKDIVCSTALWLIVREGTGGVGRISRKGDGWKLRS